MNVFLAWLAGSHPDSLARTLTRWLAPWFPLSVSLEAGLRIQLDTIHRYTHLTFAVAIKLELCAKWHNSYNTITDKIKLSSIVCNWRELLLPTDGPSSWRHTAQLFADARVKSLYRHMTQLFADTRLKSLYRHMTQLFADTRLKSLYRHMTQLFADTRL